MSPADRALSYIARFCQDAARAGGKRPTTRAASSDLALDATFRDLSRSRRIATSASRRESRLPFVLSEVEACLERLPQAGSRRGHAPRTGFDDAQPERGFGRSDKVEGASDGGFTLIEIMVALAVFSLAALALIRLEGQTIRSTGIVRATLLAQMVARNVAIDAVTAAQPPARGTSGGTEENGGLPWRWTRTVSAIGDGDVMRVDVTVADAAGAPLGRMTMVRPPSPPIEVAR